MAAIHSVKVDQFLGTFQKTELKSMRFWVRILRNKIFADNTLSFRRKLYVYAQGRNSLNFRGFLGTSVSHLETNKPKGLKVAKEVLMADRLNGRSAQWLIGSMVDRLDG